MRCAPLPSLPLNGGGSGRGWCIGFQVWLPPPPQPCPTRQEGEEKAPMVHRTFKSFAMPNKQARHLRSNQTKAEKALWQLLRKRQIAGHRFRRQHPIGPFIADFVCLERRVIIEADGDVHDYLSHRSNDCERDAWLSAQRFRILRVSNEAILTDPKLTHIKIHSFLSCTSDRIVHLTSDASDSR